MFRVAPETYNGSNFFINSQFESYGTGTLPLAKGTIFLPVCKKSLYINLTFLKLGLLGEIGLWMHQKKNVVKTFLRP